MSKIVRLSEYRRRIKRESRQVYFTRRELNLLLSLYSHRVIGGEWKDYAIDQGKGLSAFSVFGNRGDRPIFTIFKFSGGTHQNGDFVVGSGGNTLKRGRSLTEVMSVFEQPLKLVSN
jgi:hypothetical protein